MKRSWIVNLVLLAGVVALSLYTWHQGKQPKTTGHKISELSAATVKRIEVTSHDAAPYVLEKHDDTWMLTAPLQARADQTQVRRVLELLGATSEEQLAATDLKRFDLDQPKLKITVDGQTFAFGGSNPLTQDQYLLTGDHVYLVSSFFLSLVPRAPDLLLTHSVLRESEIPTAFVFKTFRVEQTDGKWVLRPEPAEKERPSQDDLNRWVDEWRHASSLATRISNETSASETVQVKLANGKAIEFLVLRTRPDLILARPDEKLQFQFSAESSRRLLDPRAKEASDARAP